MKTIRLQIADCGLRIDRQARRASGVLPALAAALLCAAGWHALLGQTPNAPGKPSAAAPATQQAEDIQDFVLFTDVRPVLVRLHIDVGGQPLRAAWRESVDRVFNRLDANRDGALSPAELEKLPPPQLLFTDANGPFQVSIAGPPTMTQLDTNRDGKVTRDELANYLRRNGGAPFQTGSAQQDLGFVLVDDFGRAVRQQSTPDLNDALFNLLDKNKDGKLSRAELLALPSTLLARDENEDEMVSADELLPGMAGAVGRVAFAPRGMMGQQADDPNLFVVESRQSSRPLARRLQTRYGGLKTPAEDVKLDRHRLGLDDESFNRLDVNKDGTLDLDELAQFAQKPVDLELSVLVSKTSSVRPNIEPASTAGQPGPVASLVKPIRDGGISFTLGNALVEVRGVKPFSGVNLNNEWANFKQNFKALDRDGNGYLDMNESRQSPFFRPLFKVMDRDHDGKLFEKEMLAYLDELRELRKLARAVCVSLSITEQGGSLFELLDTDRDGRLSVREMRQAVQLLEKLKLGTDGQLTRSAIPRTLQLNVGQGGATANQGIRRGPVARMQRQQRQTAKGPLWFRKMDRNHDGDVSRREFLGTAQQFAQIDTDGDGLISVEEAESADARSRQAKTGGK